MHRSTHCSATTQALSLSIINVARLIRSACLEWPTPLTPRTNPSTSETLPNELSAMWYQRHMSNCLRPNRAQVYVVAMCKHLWGCRHCCLRQCSANLSVSSARKKQHAYTSLTCDRNSHASRNHVSTIDVSDVKFSHLHRVKGGTRLSNCQLILRFIMPFL